VNNGVGNYFQDQADNAGAPNAGTYNGGVYAPGDSGISVALTQLRNLLTGTRLYDPTGTSNGDTNFVMSLQFSPQTQTVVRLPVPLPNNVADAGDTVGGATQVTSAGIQAGRFTQPVAGRWGDSGLIPTQPVGGMSPPPLFSPVIPGSNPTAYTLIFQTPV